MSYGYSGTGNFHNNRTAVSFYGTPYSDTPYFNIVYRNRATQSAFAYWILQNGNSASSRINKYSYAKLMNKKY